jgi:hypothetical protein
VIRCVRYQEDGLHYQEDGLHVNNAGGRGPVLEPVWLTAAVVHLLVKGCCR